MIYFLYALIFLFCSMVPVIADSVAVARDPFLPALSSTASPILKNTWIPLYFAKAADVANFLTKSSVNFLSAAGNIRVDERTNQIWIQDDAAHIHAIEKIISHLDQREPQFLIKAKIIHLDKQYQRALGVLFQTTNTASAPTTLQFNESNTANQPVQFSFAIAKLMGGNLLDLQLSALEQEGHAVLISSPELTTLNHQAALIESGAEVPYQAAASRGATKVSFKKAVLSLQVTPEVMPHHHILLKITLNQDKVSELRVNGVPAIQTQKIATQVIVRNHQTIVLGGIMETASSKQNQDMPGIHSIPILGALLSHQSRRAEQSELLIFITPSRVN